jgi:hypothetical protein
MHRRTTLRALVVTASMLATMVAPAAAIDGRTPISQSRAATGHVTPGDAPGFPVTISKAGSYVLTGNLTVPNSNTTAIEITADDVTLDLNGFSILGPTVCVGGQGGLCPGTGHGVVASDVDNVTVVNGTVRGMGRHGIVLAGVGNRVERVHARNNGEIGIGAGPVATITNNRATDNGGDGIWTGSGSVVAGNAVFRNLGNGVATNPGTAVTGNAAFLNTGSGISAKIAALVIGNMAYRNTDFGLEAGGWTGYSQNAFVLNNNNVGVQVSGGAINGGQNVCGTDAVCP